jgi:sporulation protein YlmC with PRC-barrel domain
MKRLANNTGIVEGRAAHPHKRKEEGVMQRPYVLSATTVTNDSVVNSRGEDLGKIEDIMLDMDDGRIAYAVVSFGGFLGIGDKLFAVPWNSMQIDADNHRFVLDVPKEKLENAPGFDKNSWPDFADRSLGREIYEYYGTPTYW